MNTLAPGEDQWVGIDEIQEARDAVRLPPLARISGLQQLAACNLRLPPDWRQLAGLKVLEIGGEVHSFDWRPSLKGLICLQRLWLHDIPLPGGRLPTAVCRLPALRALRLSGRGSLALPKAFTSGLDALTELALEGFDVHSVPVPVRQLPALQRLTISTAETISGLPPGPYLSSLTALSLPRQDCRAGLPAFITVATGLRRLNVGQAQWRPRLQVDAQLLAAMPHLRVQYTDQWGGLHNM